MNPKMFTPLFFFLSMPILSAPSPQPDPYTASCNSNFTCGNLSSIPYPFWGDTNTRPERCRHQDFKLENCQEGNINSSPNLKIGPLHYRVLSIDSVSKTLKIARIDLWGTPCPNRVVSNTTLGSSLFHYTTSDENVTLLYGCTKVPDVSEFHYKFPCNGEMGYMAVGELLANALGAFCRTRMVVPVLSAVLPGGTEVLGVLKQGFEVTWSVEKEGLCSECNESGKKCEYDPNRHEYRCICQHGLAPGGRSCDEPPADGAAAPETPAVAKGSSSRGKRNWVLKTIIGIVATLFGMGAMAFVAFLYFRRKKNQYVASSLLSRSRSISSNPSAKMDSEKGGNYPGVHIFSYNELEEATNNFDSAKELGDGGFGTVYHGKLRDGRYVAVKRLYENNYRRLEQFMNEVEILTRLRHQNLVSLYGCTSRHSRELLLVYEYVPNGTVADHLHGDLLKSGSLTWPIRMSIAIETANALTYLHASDIIHRDVKTTNILLDNNFCVKVADFGLSRLFPTDVTHISTAPQGTPGYVDPEYHQCYQLTDKSDVYSFGVVLIELISSKPAVDITRHRHEINLSSMAISKIQNHTLHELVDPSLGFEKDDNARKMIAAVAELAFQCLQSEKEMRPSMEEVLEGLKRIQCEAHKTEKAGEMEMQGDDAVLLKSKVLTLSPDTVTVNWTSRSTTPNASS